MEGHHDWLFVSSLSCFVCIYKDSPTKEHNKIIKFQISKMETPVILLCCVPGVIFKGSQEKLEADMCIFV